MQVLEDYSEGRAGVNEVMRGLVSHRDWFAPLELLAAGVEEQRSVGSILILGNETLAPPGRLWVFTDREAAEAAVAKGAPLGAYGGGISGTELFRIITPDLQTVYVNPGSPPARTWLFSEGSASDVGGLWAEAIALEESFAQWRQTGGPDREALVNYRAFLLFDFLSGPVAKLPGGGGMSNPAAAFTAPDCAAMFLSKLSDEQRGQLKQVTIDGARLFASPPAGIDGLLFNVFGPGETYALPLEMSGAE
jgi:hypothetical protein